MGGTSLNRLALCLTLSLCAAPLLVAAQTTTAPAELANPSLSPTPAAARAGRTARTKAKNKEVALKPFSRIGLSGGISLMGVNLQAATNVNRYINLRATGNYFKYSMDNQEINDYTVNGNLNFATAAVSADFYPFPRHGLRFSPGVMFYNQNSAAADVTVKGGTSLSLNDYDYYSSSAHPIQGTAKFALNKRNPAFTATTGWGNLISRRGGHWSFPVEVGVAFVDEPKIDMALTSGQACDASGSNCVDVSSYTDLQNNLQAQVKKYQNDVSLLKFYPIISFGVGYNFRIRK